jgi:hypothetical protein
MFLSKKKGRLLALECKFRLSTSQPDIQIKSHEICTWKVVLCRHSSLDSQLLFCLSVSPPPRTLSTTTPSLTPNTSQRGFPLVFPAPLQCSLPLHQAPPLRCTSLLHPCLCINAPGLHAVSTPPSPVPCPMSVSTPPLCALCQRPCPCAPTSASTQTLHLASTPRPLCECHLRCALLCICAPTSLCPLCLGCNDKLHL